MYLSLKILNIVWLVLIYFTMCVNTKKCQSFFNDSKFYLGTKTPYSYIANLEDDPILFNGCKATRIWSIIRHGTRNPGKSLEDKMRINLPALKMIVIGHHESGKGSLCPEVIDKLRPWEPSVDPSELKFLTHEGEEEMLLLGERFQNRFLNLLPEKYCNKTYKFKYTATQRAKESARSFTIGLFGKKQSSYVWYPEPLHKDPILRFYKLCDKWRVEVDKNPEALKELEKFKTKPLVTQMLDNISERIGLTHRIKYDDARLIYQTCSFETAWHPKNPSPWCGLLTKEDFEILEFAQDLDYYWIDGYGYFINYRQACVAMKDMFRHLTDESYPPATFYFTHSGTILKVLSYLGLYRDTHPLTADLFNKSRLWRTSQIDAFGSNLAFILFKCKGEDKVLTMHQERPVILPGCPEGELCPLNTVKKIYKNSIDDCNFYDMCTLHRGEL